MLRGGPCDMVLVLSAAIVAAQIASAPIIGFGFGVGYTLGARTGYEIIFELLKAGKREEAEKMLLDVRTFAKNTGTSAATEFGLSRYINDLNEAGQTPTSTEITTTIQSEEGRPPAVNEVRAAQEAQIIDQIGNFFSALTTKVTELDVSNALPNVPTASGFGTGSPTIPLTAEETEFNVNPASLNERIDLAISEGKTSITIDGLTYDLGNPIIKSSNFSKTNKVTVPLETVTAKEEPNVTSRDTWLLNATDLFHDYKHALNQEAVARANVKGVGPTSKGYNTAADSRRQNEKLRAAISKTESERQEYVAFIVKGKRDLTNKLIRDVANQLYVSRPRTTN